MTQSEFPEPTSPSSHHGVDDLLEDAISWFTGRSARDEAVDGNPEEPVSADAVVGAHEPEVVASNAGGHDSAAVDHAAQRVEVPQDHAVAAADVTHAPAAGVDEVRTDRPAEGVASATATPTWRHSPLSADRDLPSESASDIAVEHGEPVAIADSLDTDPSADVVADEPPARTGMDAHDETIDQTVEVAEGDHAPEAIEADETIEAAETIDAELASDESVAADAAAAAEAAEDQAVAEATDASGAEDLVDPDATAEHTVLDDEVMPPADAIDSEAGLDDRPEPPASLFRDEPLAPVAAGAAAAGAAGLAAYATTKSGPDETAVLDEAGAARRRAEEREARDRQLGKVQPLSTAPAATPHALPSTYRAIPTLGLLLLRFVTAGIVGIRAFMHAMDIAGLQKLWADHTILAPQALTAAWVQTGLEAAIAVMLLFGLGTRIAGALLTALSAALLALMLWGAANPFQPGMVGFIGEIEVLLAAVGLTFLGVGGGRAAIDGTIHKNRIDTKNERLLA